MERGLVLAGLAAAAALWLSSSPRSARVLLLAVLLLQADLLRRYGASLLDAGATVSGPWQAAMLTLLGRLYAAQALLVALALVFSAWRWRWGVPLAAAAALASGAATGHGVLAADDLADALVALAHPLLASVWFAGLVGLLLRWQRDGRDAGARALAAFSRVALPLMAALLASGLWIAGDTVARWAALFGTAYGQGLALKLLGVAAALACAAVLRHALAHDRAARPASVRWLAIEAMLALAAFATAGWVADQVPAAHDRIDWPFPFRMAPEAASLLRGQAWPWPQVVAVGLLAAGAGAALALWRTRRPQALAGAAACATIAAALALPTWAVDAHPSTYHAAPAPYDSRSVAAGAQLYARHCTGCHGAQGRGDGPLAASLARPPANLTEPHVGWHTHGDLWWWLTHGIAGTPMPGFADRTTAEERWQIVDHLMALSLGHQARPLGAAPRHGQRWLPAIDIPAPGPEGGEGRLSDWRRSAAVLLVLLNDASESDRVTALAAQAPALATAGLQVVVVQPPGLPLPAAPPGLVTDADGDIARAWSHYRRSLAHVDADDRQGLPARTEWLIDRDGYVRARWRSDEAPAAPNEAALRQALALMAGEPPAPPADAHAH